MPTPRAHGGAPLQHFPLNLPGFKGLNKQARGAVLGPEWATRLENTVLDTSNRLASRKGWNPRTTTAAGEDFVQLTEYVTAGGTTRLIATGDGGTLYHSTDDGATWADVTDTATVVNSNMQFGMFNDELLGFQENGGIVMYDGTDFEDLTVNSGTAPDGRVGLCAFGRVWGVDFDQNTIRISAILDATRWDEADGGATIDMMNVWPNTDTVQALAAFNGALVVFGKRNIVIWEDGEGSTRGLDPLQMYIADTISGVGCLSRDSVVNVKGDLWFLDDTGVQSLGRLINEKSNPLINISANVQDELLGFAQQANANNMRAVYSPEDRFYLLSIPLGTATETGVVFCFDTRGFLENGAARCAGLWNQMVPTAMIVRDNLSLVMALKEIQGEVGTYSGFLDNLDSYVLDYESGWTDLQSPTLKILKRIAALMFIQSATTVTMKWAFDFADTFTSAQVTFPSSGDFSEWNVGEFNEDEFGGGVALSEKRTAGRGTGEYIKLGFSVNINAEEVSCQQLTLYAKEGRLH